jgi:hypothetical protein
MRDVTASSSKQKTRKKTRPILFAWRVDERTTKHSVENVTEIMSKPRAGSSRCTDFLQIYKSQTEFLWMLRHRIFEPHSLVHHNETVLILRYEANKMIICEIVKYLILSHLKSWNHTLPEGANIALQRVLTVGHCSLCSLTARRRWIDDHLILITHSSSAEFDV